jgi:hypothetical protein
MGRRLPPSALEMTGAMRIDCYLSEHCGSYHQLNANIGAALRELGIMADVRFPTVSYEEAMDLGIRGSPTIRIDGRDIVDEGSPGIL